MLKIVRPGFGTFQSYAYWWSSYDNAKLTFFGASNGAVTSLAITEWQGRLASEYIRTRAGSYGAKSCQNLQFDLSVINGGPDLSVFGCSPFDAHDCFVASGSTYTWKEPDSMFYTNPSTNCFYFWSNCAWRYGQYPVTSPTSSCYTRSTKCWKSGSIWYQNAQCASCVPIVTSSGHIMYCWYLAAALNSLTYYRSLSGLYAIYANSKWYYYNGSAWTTSYKQFSKSVSVDDWLSYYNSPGSDPFGYASAAAIAAASVPTTSGSLMFTSVSSSDTQSIIDEANRLCDSVLAAYESFLQPVTNDEWSVLADTCIDNMQQVSVNSPLLIKELVETGTGILQISKGDFSSLPSSIESAWLSARYGLRLTASDLSEVVKALRNQLLATYEPSDFYTVKSMASLSDSLINSHVGSISRNIYYQVRYRNKDYMLLNVIRGLMDWDLWPSLGNAWDAIPLSFVVDWFVDVESVFEYFDRRIYEEYIDVLQVIYTYKDVFTPKVPTTWLDVNNLSMTYYVRRLRSSLHIGPPTLSGGSASNVNIIDGTALLIQCAH